MEPPGRCYRPHPRPGLHTHAERWPPSKEAASAASSVPVIAVVWGAGHNPTPRGLPKAARASSPPGPRETAPSCVHPEGKAGLRCVIISLITGSHGVLSVLAPGSLHPAGSQLPLVLTPATHPSSLPTLLPLPGLLWRWGVSPGWQPGPWVSFLVETDHRQDRCRVWSDATRVRGGNTRQRLRGVGRTRCAPRRCGH